MKPLFIFLRWLPWLCTPALLSAQNQLTVSVLDATSKEPVVGATLSAKMQHWGAVTDSAGAIIIPADFKEAQIHVHCIGYRPWAGAIPPARVILIEPDESLLGTVVVTATMKEVSKDVSPIPVEIYTHRFFQKSASPSIFEALVAVNGVKPQLNCNVCNTGDIHINGMEGPYTMVTIDGMPLVGGLASVYGLSGIPNGIVDRIEIIKGPAGVLFGSEAVGGVVNIITKNTQSAPRLFADVYMASNQEFNTELAYNSRIGKARNLTGVNYFNYQNPQDINGDNFTDVALQHRISIFNKTAVALKNQQFATLGWRYIYEDRWGGELQWSPQWRGTDSIYGESIYTKRFELIAKLPFNIRKQLFQLDLSGNLHHQNSAYGTTLFLGNQHITFGQLSTTINHNEQVETLIGAAVRYTFYNDNTPATTSVSRTWLPGVFLQSMFRLNNRNTLLGGLRYDYNSIHRHILTPRVSWKWSPEPGHALRLTAGSGYRVANIFTEDHAALTGAREVVIAENLLPERSWNGNLNYTRKFYPGRIGYLGVDGSLFYTYFSNQILPDYDTDPDKIIYKNLRGYAVSTGLSINLDVNFLNGVKLIAGATAMDVFRQEAGIRQPQLFAPPLSGTWTLTWPIPAWKCTIDYTGNLNSPMPLPVQPNDPRPDRSPWFSIHNLQITKQINRQLECYLGVKNVFGFYPKGDIILRAFDPFDKKTNENNPLGLTFDPTYNYAPIQRQRLLIGLRYQLKT